MKPASILLALCLASATFPQEPQRHYARAYYTKWKPGMAAEGQAFLKGVPHKAALEWLKVDPSAVGEVRMTRLLPGGAEVGHDRLRLLITTTPPPLPFTGVSPGTSRFVEAAGMKPAEYAAKMGSLVESIRTEIWRSAYRHGSIREGQIVSIRRYILPEHKRPARRAVNRDWDNAMYAETVKSGGLRASEGWEVLFAAEDEPAFAYLAVYPDAESLYKGRGNFPELFAKAHPGKDINEYRRVAERVGEDGLVAESILYRVDAAVWK